MCVRRSLQGRDGLGGQGTRWRRCRGVDHLLAQRIQRIGAGGRDWRLPGQQHLIGRRIRMRRARRRRPPGAPETGRSAVGRLARAGPEAVTVIPGHRWSSSAKVSAANPACRRRSRSPGRVRRYSKPAYQGLRLHRMVEWPRNRRKSRLEPRNRSFWYSEWTAGCLLRRLPNWSGLPGRCSDHAAAGALCTEPGQSHQAPA